MKTLCVRHSHLGLAIGLAFFLGCAGPSAQTEQPKSVATPIPAAPVAVETPSAVAQALPTIANASPAVTDAAPVTAAGTNGPAIEQRIPPGAQPQTVQLSPGL